MNPLRYVHSWPAVVAACFGIAALVGIFALAGPDERITFLGILSMVCTAGVAFARQAFAVPKEAPKRIQVGCPVGYLGADGRSYRCAALHAAGSRACCSPNPETKAQALRERAASPPVPDRDDDDGDAGSEVLVDDDGPPTTPRPRVPARVTHPPRAAVKDSLTAHLGHPRSLVRSIQRHGIALACLVLSACSPSALQTHATIASVTGHVFDTACAEVETARSREQHAIADGPLDRDESRVAVDAVRARWAPALASCELAADTHDAWVTTLALAAAGAPFTLADGLALAQQALSVWQSLSATLMIAGVEMPAVPAELVALVGGGL